MHKDYMSIGPCHHRMDGLYCIPHSACQPSNHTHAPLPVAIQRGREEKRMRCWASSSQTQQKEAPDRVNNTLSRLLQTVPGGKAEAGLAAADRFWSELCNSAPYDPPEAITEVSEPISSSAPLDELDVVVLGGTLGIFLATALQRRGKSVAVLERNQLLGREQEWNISRADMAPFVEEGILTAEQVEEVIISEFNPVRVGFEGITEIVTKDILNCGVSPKRIIELLKDRFLSNGGTLLEGTAFQRARVHPDGVVVSATRRASQRQPQGAGGAGGEGNAQLQASTSGRTTEGEQIQLRCKVVVDALGGFSPITRQRRKGRKPDSVVLMVGSCSNGLPEAKTADLLYSFNPLNRKRRLQYFWETFPANDGVTTYMFCYTDPVPGRASLRDLYEDYVDLLPEYCGRSDLEGVTFRRAMFGVVPNWHDSPPTPLTSRLLHVGDSAGNRSALSFAGFGAMARHLRRLRKGLEEALELGLTDTASLGLLQPYSPAISMTAAMQFSMGTREGQRLEEFDDQIINDYIGASFKDMRSLGPQVYRPFMQDFLQWGALSRIVGRQVLTQPGALVRMTLFMRSPAAGQMFVANFAMLLAYDVLFRVARAVAPAHERLLPPKLLYRWRRMVSSLSTLVSKVDREMEELEAFEYGSANDYKESSSGDE